MSDLTLESEIRDEILRLPVNQRQRVLEFARALSGAAATGIAGRSLSRFAGTISTDDLAAMASAIEDGCEQIDRDAW